MVMLFTVVDAVTSGGLCNLLVLSSAVVYLLVCCAVTAAWCCRLLPIVLSLLADAVTTGGAVTYCR